MAFHMDARKELRIGEVWFMLFKNVLLLATLANVDRYVPVMLANK